MSIKRLQGIPGFSIDKVAKAAGSDPEVLRLENLDTDLLPPKAAVEATKLAVHDDDCNSYLPFTGNYELCKAVCSHVTKLCGIPYAYDKNCIITCGGTESMFDTLLATVDIGDEVILTDPTYAGMIYRVKLAGAVPKLVPFVWADGDWRLDLEALRAAVSDKTKALFILSPSMPSGAVLNRTEWQAIADICTSRNIWLIYNAAFERILYDGREYIHPASLPGMDKRTITCGSVSKEYRMIGWRVGWVVGPAEIMNDIALVGIYNVVMPTAISSTAAIAALTTPDDGLAACVAEWQTRRDVIVSELAGLPLYKAGGAWSMLIDTKALGYDCFTASKLLLERSKIAATPMADWGAFYKDAFVRLVFSNEPVARLKGIGDKVKYAFKL